MIETSAAGTALRNVTDHEHTPRTEVTMTIPDEAVEAATETMAEMWNQRLSEEDAPYIPSDFTLDARDILSAAAPIIRAQERQEAEMPAIRQQVDAQPEVIDAWYALVDHEAFTPCRDEEAPLLDSMLDRLTNLVDIESAVTELRRSSADDEIRADERLRIAEKEREMSERKYTIPEAAVEAAARAMYEHRPKHTDPARWETPWDEVPEGWKQGQRDAARVVLEAAAKATGGDFYHYKHGGFFACEGLLSLAASTTTLQDEDG